jgi:peptidoglycan/LPS O-acetylase OafA/YrhL
MAVPSRLSNFTKHNHNNFDLLRFLAAVIVIHGHIYGHEYQPIQFPWGQGVGGQLGVLIFFFISGFLVTQSWIKTKNTAHYLLKRSARIFPGLILIVIVTALMIGPLVTDIPDYWRKQELYIYIASNITLFCQQYALPGITYGSKINPQFWTLRVEFALYLVVLVLGFCKRLNVFFVLSIALSLSFLLPLTPEQIKLFSAILSFCFGASAYLLADKIMLKNSYAFAAAIILASCFYTLCVPIAVLAVGYLICWAAAAPVKWMHHFGKYGDASYGMYLSSFLIQWLLVRYVPIHWQCYSLFPASLLLAAGYGYHSWHMLEKPALAWAKKRHF